MIYGVVMSDGMPLVNNCDFGGIQSGCVCRVDRRYTQLIVDIGMDVVVVQLVTRLQSTVSHILSQEIPFTRQKFETS